MSDIYPTASQQLAAASLAFHRAIRIFSQNSSKFACYENSVPIGVTETKENGERGLKHTSGLDCREYCKQFQQEKIDSSNLRVDSFVKNSPHKKINGLKEFQRKSNYCHCQQILITAKDSVDQNLINHPQSWEIGDRKNDDESLNFFEKLHEWERRSREESLMKMQRFCHKVKKSKEQCHCCQSFSPTACKCRSRLNKQQESNIHVEVGKKNFNERINHSRMKTVGEDIDEEDSVKNFKPIEHRDSIDILVEKFRSKRIQEEQIDEVDPSFSSAVETVSTPFKAGIQPVLGDATKKSKKRGDNDDRNEICHTHRNACNKESCFNRMENRARRKQCTKLLLANSTAFYSNEEDNASP